MTGLLDGLKVLDLSLWQPGQYATQLLADLGATVVKIEPPGGDRMRALPDRFVNINGHKRSIALDLKVTADREQLLRLGAEAEVVVEGYRPGVATRLGVGYEDFRAVNPAIVYCSISGFGQNGPLADQTGHDHNYQAYAGMMVVPAEGATPIASGGLAGDQGSGLAAAFAICAAVLSARRTGEGEYIDVSITDLLASWVAPMGAISEQQAAAAPQIAAPAMGVFAAGDGGHVVLGVFTEDRLWDSLCRALQLDELVGLDVAERSARAPALRAAITARLAGYSRDEVVALLGRDHVPVAPVLSRAEMLEHPHFRERGTITTRDGSRVLGHPIRYLHHPARPPGPVPRLDQHHGEGFDPRER